jgi:hypothetical protein
MMALRVDAGTSAASPEVEVGPAWSGADPAWVGAGCAAEEPHALRSRANVNDTVSFRFMESPCFKNRPLAQVHSSLICANRREFQLQLAKISENSRKKFWRKKCNYSAYFAFFRHKTAHMAKNLNVGLFAHIWWHYMWRVISIKDKLRHI